VDDPTRDRTERWQPTGLWSDLLPGVSILGPGK